MWAILWSISSLPLILPPWLRSVLIGIREHDPQDGDRHTQYHVPEIFHATTSQTFF